MSSLIQARGLKDRFLHLGLGWIGDNGGGLERYQHGICLSHARLGCTVSAWVQSRCPISTDVTYSVNSYASPTEKRRKKLARLKALAIEQLTSSDCTVISHHASVSGTISFYTRKNPHVFHFQGPWADEAKVEGAPWWKTLLQRREELKVMATADRIITLSQAFKELVTQNYSIDPEIVTVVPGAIDVEAANPGVTRMEARSILGWPTDRPIVIAMRRLVRRVGLDTLIEAIGNLSSDFLSRTGLLVLIGGKGPLAKMLRDRVESLGISEHVKFLGFVPEAQLSLAYRAADMSIVPTQALEGFGLVTLESLAAGTPAMVTPVGSLPEVISDLCPNLVLPGSDAAQLREGLMQFCQGSLSLPSEMLCRKYVLERYDWSVVAPRVLEVYRQAST